MAETMLQISVARRAAAILGLPESGILLLGAIAPDSVRIRPNATREDYARIHSLDPDWSGAYKAALRLMESEGDDPYLLGCAFHLMTDSLWATYRHELAQGLPEDMPEEEKRNVLRNETEALERLLYLRDNGRTTLQAILSTPIREDRGYLGLSVVEVDAWRRRCNQTLSNMKRDQQLTILTAAAADVFVQKTSDRIAREYRRIQMEKKA